MSRGFILMEAAVCILVLSLALAALLTMFSMTLKASRSTQNVIVATQLAQEMLEEVRLRKWDQETPTPAAYIQTPSAIGIDAGEVATEKTTFNDIDDFNGWSEKPANGPLQTALNVAFSSYTRTVTVAYVDPNLNATAGPTDWKQVTACAQPPGNLKAVCLDTILTNR
jgi:MSHA pilin protein MshD